ncbi:hypothetical protein CFP56_026474 [Quercus suber]|uniref:Uncharacterized protein n=1 Tax=Quercus suber TaxID=58331 RepID=A0AAW0LVP6_QUESU
MEVHCDSSKLG